MIAYSENVNSLGLYTINYQKKIATTVGGLLKTLKQINAQDVANFCIPKF